jgi:hypothetical protein
MADKTAMRAALKDVLMDLKKAMRSKRAARFKKGEDESEEEEEKEGSFHEEAEAMGSGRDDDGGSGSSSSDREHGGRVSSASKGKDSSGASPFREEMMGFMTGRGLKARPGKSAPIISGQKKPQAKRGRPKGASKGMGA